MKALGLVVSDKKIFESCILKTYLLTPWPTYATNQNYLDNFGSGLSRNRSCWVCSKSNKQFQRRRCLSKKLIDYARQTTNDRRQTTDVDGQRPVTIAHHSELKNITKTVKLWHYLFTSKTIYLKEPITPGVSNIPGY